MSRFACVAVSPPTRRWNSFACRTCGGSFSSQQSTAAYCSKACQSKGVSAKIAQLWASKAPACIHCGAPVLRKKRSGRQIAAGYRQRTCSRRCRSIVNGLEAQARRVSHQCAQENKRAADASVRAAARAQADATRSAVRACILSARVCRECGVSIATRGPQARYCTVCGPLVNRRINHARRRVARKTGEAVDPIKVFERDGWKCHLCLRMTLPGQRGSYHPRAPELDHIVPLAKGGSHTYANAACSCRKCNRLKRDRVAGQPSLLPPVSQSSVGRGFDSSEPG